MKAAQGTLQPCRRHRQIDMTAATLTPEPPVGLNKDARAAWQLAVECARAVGAQLRALSKAGETC